MPTRSEFDVIVIGAGPGGYVAAIRAAQLGFKTACVDRWLNAAGKPALGGTCLNAGCIPSKALLDSSLHYHNLSHLLPAHGIQAGAVMIDVPTMQARKDKIVTILTSGIKGLFKKNKITWFPGQGSFLSSNQIVVSPHQDSNDRSVLEAPNIIIATGSVPMALPAIPVDNRYIFDSTGALNFQVRPKSLGIIGAGIIGLELGSVWNRLGSKVVLLEANQEFLIDIDREISKEAHKILKKQGLDIQLGTSVESATPTEDSVTIDYKKINGEIQSIQVEKLVVACGRYPATSGLGLENIGLKTDDQGRIDVNDDCCTKIKGIYAIGDVVRGPMLAHKASEEGIAVAERIAGQIPSVSHETIPWVIYTHPEIAWVGKTEQMLKDNDISFRVGKFPLRAIGRAHASGETDGFIKILAHTETDRILGAHLFSTHASELVMEIVTAMEFSASSEDIARTIHAHPTLSEATHEAALAVHGRTIHL